MLEQCLNHARVVIFYRQRSERSRLVEYKICQEIKLYSVREKPPGYLGEICATDVMCHFQICLRHVSIF